MIFSFLQKYLNVILIYFSFRFLFFFHFLFGRDQFVFWKHFTLTFNRVFLLFCFFFLLCFNYKFFVSFFIRIFSSLFNLIFSFHIIVSHSHFLFHFISIPPNSPPHRSCHIWWRFFFLLNQTQYFFMNIMPWKHYTVTIIIGDSRQRVRRVTDKISSIDCLSNSPSFPQLFIQNQVW